MVEILYELQIREYGGSRGLRDAGALESALARPLNRHVYHPAEDLCGFAAAYGYGLTNNHPFADGNKRIGFIAMGAFLRRNGLAIKAREAEVVELMLAIADRRCDEEQLALWLREHTVSAEED